MNKKQPESIAAFLGMALPGQVASRLPGRRLLAVWPKVAGELIAARVRPICLEEGGRLVLAAPGPIWRQELSLRSPEFLAGFNAQGVELTGIKVVELRLEPKPAPEPPPPPLDEADEAQVQAIVGQVAEPDLKNALERAIRAQIRARKTADI